MQKNLNYEGFEQYMVDQEYSFWGTTKYVFMFENGYGASVINGMNSYGHEEGLWELAVVKFDKELNDWRLNYETSITNDVIGWLTDEGVRDLLKRIKEL